MRERLDCVQNGARTGRHQLGGFAGHDRFVLQLDRDRSAAARLGTIQRAARHPALGQLDLVLVHQQTDALHRFRSDVSRLIVAFRLIIAPQDLLPRRNAARFVVHDAESRHVDAHIRRRFVDPFIPRDLCQNRFDDRKTLDVSIVIDRRFPVRLQMIGVDHVDIAKVCRSRLVCHVHRVHRFSHTQP